MVEGRKYLYDANAEKEKKKAKHEMPDYQELYIKSCPFCGSVPRLDDITEIPLADGAIKYKITCSICGCSLERLGEKAMPSTDHFFSMRKIVRAWNTRTPASGEDSTAINGNY